MPTVSRMNRASAGGVAEKVGGSATTDTDVNVTTSTTKILDANTNRRYIALVNTGDSDIRIRFNQSATTGTGVQIKSGGGSVVFDNVVPTAQLNGISESATTAISVIEY